MKSRLTIVIFFSLLIHTAGKLKAQTATLVTDKDSTLVGGEYVFNIAEKMPEFPGGDAALDKFIKKNIKYPKYERKNGIGGNVYVQFIVKSNGEIYNPKILKGVDKGEGLNYAALKVINAMPPWIPGKQNGRYVSTFVNLPITFVLK
jgi:protein TonB